MVAHWTHNPKVAGSSPACASYSNQGGEAIGSKQWVRITKMIACFLFDVLNRENRWKTKQDARLLYASPKNSPVSYFLTTKTKSMQKNKCYNDPGETQTDEVEGGQEVPGTEEQSNEGEN